MKTTLIVMALAACAAKDRAVTPDAAVSAEEAQAAYERELARYVRVYDAKDAPAFTADEFVQAYEANEVATDVRLRGKIVRLRGAVRRVERAFAGMRVVLETASRTVELHFDEEQEAALAVLQPGHNIVARGIAEARTGGSFRVLHCIIESATPATGPDAAAPLTADQRRAVVVEISRQFGKNKTKLGDVRVLVEGADADRLVFVSSKCDQERLDQLVEAIKAEFSGGGFRRVECRRNAEASFAADL